MVADFVRYYTRTTISHSCRFGEILHANHTISWFQILWDITPEPQYLMIAYFVRYYTRTTISHGCRFREILHQNQNISWLQLKGMPLALVPNWANCMWFHLFLVQIQSKSGHSWQGLLCLNAKSWLRCSHISQPGLTQLYSVHHEFTKIWCFNINISQSSDLWDIYLVNPSSILALKPHSNCLRLVLHASIKVNDDGLPRVVLAQLFLNLILILNLIPK